jgi:chlorite dismutase
MLFGDKMAKILGIVDMRFVVMVGLDDPQAVKQVVQQLKMAIEGQYLMSHSGSSEQSSDEDLS